MGKKEEYKREDAVTKKKSLINRLYLLPHTTSNRALSLSHYLIISFRHQLSSFCSRQWLLSYHSKVAKLVHRSYGRVVEKTSFGDPARVGIITEQHQLVLSWLVANKVDGLAHIRHDNAVAINLNTRYQVWNMLVFAFAQQFFLAQLINSQKLAHAGQQAPFKGHHRSRNVLDLPVNQYFTR